MAVHDREQFLVPKQDEAMAAYYDAANVLYTAQDIGATQEQLDKLYANAMKLGEAFPADKRLQIDKIRSTRNPGADARAMAMETVISLNKVPYNRFNLPSRSDVWIP